MMDSSDNLPGFLDRIRSWLGMTGAAAGPVKTPLDTNTRLAHHRTFLAYERTLMAWVRTASSLITFGFSIYKFFQLEFGMGKEFAAAQVVGPRQFSMILIVIGVVSLVMATIQHRGQVQMLKREYAGTPRSTAGIVAGLISVMGLLAILAVVFRL